MWLFLDKRNEEELLFNTNTEILGYIELQQIKQYSARWVKLYTPPEKSEGKEKIEEPMPLSRSIKVR